tara:strand:+ start:18352 stop:18840 length:489 start_codon:yes stop_codon:yes gene_type:complete
MEAPKKQWHEKADAPIATRSMTSMEIQEYRKALVMSYKCDDMDIKFYFEKITDENDADREDCMWIKYTLDTETAGRPTLRIVATLKLPIPQHLREEGERRRKEAALNKNASSQPTSQPASSQPASSQRSPSGPARAQPAGPVSAGPAKLVKKPKARVKAVRK